MINPSSTTLSRFKIIDLTQARAGPTCVRQFADWGADVIAVERPEPPGSVPLDLSKRHDPDYQMLFRHKRSMVLDLTRPEGLVVLKDLVRGADVLVENYRPDVKHRLGIDYESMRAINPRLVYTSISGFGQDGPYRERPGVDQIAQGMSGLMSVTGHAGHGPVRVGVPIGDMTTGLFAAIGTLNALLEREASGLGQWVQVSLLETLTFLMELQASRFLSNGEPAQQLGNGHPTGVPTGAYRTTDGYVNIGVLPKIWARFCKALGIEHLIDHPDYATPRLRVQHREQVDQVVAEVVGRHTSAYWVERLNAFGVPCGPIYQLDQVFDDPQVQHLGLVQRVKTRHAGEQAMMRQPVTLSRTPCQPVDGAPELGEHTETILREAGYSAERISALRSSGVLG